MQSARQRPNEYGDGIEGRPPPSSDCETLVHQWRSYQRHRMREHSRESRMTPGVPVWIPAPLFVPSRLCAEPIWWLNTAVLKRMARNLRRLTWLPLMGVVFFAVGPFSIVPMTVMAAALDGGEHGCHHSTASTDETRPEPVARHEHPAGAGDHPHAAVPKAADPDVPDCSALDLDQECPSPIPMHCCGSPSCGLTAILLGLGYLPRYQSEMANLDFRAASGRTDAISLFQPPQA